MLHLKFNLLAVLIWILSVSASVSVFTNRSFAASQMTAAPGAYRELAQKIRTAGTFNVPYPNGENIPITYEFKIKNALWPNTPQRRIDYTNDDTGYGILFYEKFLTTDDSYILIGKDKIPLTCVFVRGLDNENLKNTDSFLLPKIFLEVYLVTNDFNCVGPKNPGYPYNGQKEELWENYLYYKIKDPTIMLPMDAKLRYRWFDNPAVFKY